MPNKSFHVVQSHCAYCSFTLHEQDPAIVAPYSDGRVSATFPWKAENRWYDSDLNAELHVWKPDIYDSAPAFHEPCFRFGTGKLGMRLSGRAQDITRYGFPPLASHDRQRFVRLQGKVGLCVHAEFPALLPEICLVIAEYLVPEYAICTLDSLRTSKENCNIQITPHEDIWARYVCFEETLYLADLSNTPGPEYPVKIYGGDPDVSFLLILQDHLGVRGLVSYTMDPAHLQLLVANPMQGQFRVHVYEDGLLAFHYDGFKLRDWSQDAQTDYPELAETLERVGSRLSRGSQRSVGGFAGPGTPGTGSMM
ncbi:hypothetical protein PG997_002691 [Apiospora hydei]|uniref:Uncharacterized protein n=1 Tax=Apiospora hydei TaxID=1337664 RepID=A0ABR1WX44_9PEZI